MPSLILTVHYVETRLSIINYVIPCTGQLLGLLSTRVFSECGSLQHGKEQDTYVLFRDFLEELEGIIAY